MKIMHVKIREYLSATVIAGTLLLGLNACGGGGDGGGGGGSGTAGTAPTTPIALNSSNAEQVSVLAFESANGQIIDTVGSLPLTVQTQADKTDKASLHKFTRVVVKKLDDDEDRGEVVAAVTEQVPCSAGGNVTITVDENARTASMSFNQCGEDGLVINGSISLSGITESGTAPNVTVSMVISFTNISVTEGSETASINGSYNATVSSSNTGETNTLSGTLLTLTESGHTHDLSNFTFTETTVIATSMSTTTADYTLSSTLINGRVVVTTQTPFETDSGASYPHSGVLLVVGADSSIRMTVLGDENSLPLDQQVRLEIDADGNDTYETTVTTSWSILDS